MLRTAEGWPGIRPGGQRSPDTAVGSHRPGPGREPPAPRPRGPSAAGVWGAPAAVACAAAEDVRKLFSFVKKVYRFAFNCNILSSYAKDVVPGTSHLCEKPFLMCWTYLGRFFFYIKNFIS